MAILLLLTLQRLSSPPPQSLGHPLIPLSDAIILLPFCQPDLRHTP